MKEEKILLDDEDENALLQDGSLLWKTPVTGHIKADPLYNGELNSIYIGTTKGFAYCLNGNDGTVVWFSDLQQPIFSTPCLVDHRIVWATVGGWLLNKNIVFH